MKDVSRRGFITLGGLCISAISSASLVGCSEANRNGDVENRTSGEYDDARLTDDGDYWDSAHGTISPSTAFKQEGIWFSYGNDYDSTSFGGSSSPSISKDETITGVHIFHGDGTATSWHLYDASGLNELTFSDIDGLTDDEIENLCPTCWSFDSSEFENQRQDFISYFNSCSQEDGIDYSVAIQMAERLSASLKPSAESYVLKVQTDDSGNKTKSETLVLHYCKSPSAFTSSGRSMIRQYISSGYLDSHPGVLDGMFETNQKWPFQLSEYAEPKKVYETTYSGYEHIVLQYDGDAEFVLDDPDTDGIEID